MSFGLASYIHIYIKGGIGIYTPDLRKACVLTEQGQKRYTLMELPAVLCTGREELYYMRSMIWYTKKESIWMVIRQILWISFLVMFFYFFKYLSSIPVSRFTVGMYILCLTCYIYFEFIFQIGRLKQKSVAGKQIAKWQGALNKTISAFKKRKHSFY